jgi:hypothetical protein
MWTRSAQNKQTGLFSFTCTDWNGNVFAEGSDLSYAEVEEAGADAERRMTISMQTPALSQTELLDEMSDIELLLELGA